LLAPGVKIPSYTTGPRTKFNRNIFSIFEDKMQVSGQAGEGNPLAFFFGYISNMHFVQAAHMPNYYRRYWPSTVKSGKEAVVFAREHMLNQTRPLKQKYRYNMNFARKCQQCTLNVFGYKLTGPV